jgi:hypothetical protein
MVICYGTRILRLGFLAQVYHLTEVDTAEAKHFCVHG